MGFRFLHILPALALAPTPAEARERYCRSAYEIAPEIKACPDNEIFAAAADDCLNRFQGEVDTVTRQLSASFAANQKASVSAQESKQNNHDANLAQTDGQLRALLSHARTIKRDLREYVTTIILPGNPTMDQLMMYDIYDMLAQDYCYRDNRVRLEAHIASINQKIHELERADATANHLDAATLTHLQRLKASTTDRRPASGTHGKGAGKVPTGTSPRPGSTITGEIKNEQLK